MGEQPHVRIILQELASYYSEQEAAQYSSLDITVIHHLYAAGVLDGIEVPDKGRRYREEDLSLLRRARRLQEDLGINLEGVEIILRLSKRLQELQHELDHYRKRAEPFLEE